MAVASFLDVAASTVVNIDRPEPRTLLEQLVRRSCRTIEENCAAFERTAETHGEKATLSPRHLSRWMAGEVASARPVAQRVATLYWGFDFGRLLGPPLPEAELAVAESTVRYKNRSSGSEPRVGLPVLHQVELLRQGLHDAVSVGNLSETGLDEWDMTVQTHGQATRFRPAGQMLIELAADFTELQRLLERRHSSSALRRLTRAIAQMAGLMFLTLIKLNEPLAARNWARTARVAADEAGDNTVRAWVRAQEAYVHYYAVSLAEAIIVARQAQALAGRTPCVAVPLAAALEARAHSAFGNRAEAIAALRAAEVGLSNLDPDRLVPSAFGYIEAQLRFHEGNAYTHLHQTTEAQRAQRAQQRALTLYPHRDFLDRSLVRLDTASCMTADRDVEQAMQLATSVLQELNVEQRRGLVQLRAQEVLQSLPRSQQALPAAREFRDLLMLTRGDQ